MTMHTIRQKLMQRLKRSSKHPEREIVCIPATFSRTEKFLDEFAESLSKADQVYLCDIFGSARENKGELTIEDLQKRIDGAELITEYNNGCILR